MLSIKGVNSKEKKDILGWCRFDKEYWEEVKEGKVKAKLPHREIYLVVEKFPIRNNGSPNVSDI